MKKAASFVWRDNYLVAANHASSEKLFGEKGLRALCYCTLTGKTDVEAGLTGRVDDELLDYYRNEKLRHYENRNALQEHVGLESQISGDYSGRLFLELLQNAVDAMSDKPIGHKGLGFRVTAKFAESIRVHSGGLHFQFSRERARTLVKERTKGEIDEPLHLLSVPDSCDLHSEEPFIRDLVDIQKFDTVVVLKIKGENATVLRALEQQWAEIIRTPSTMLFLPSVEQINWVRETTTTSWERKLLTEGEGRVTLLVNGIQTEEWRVSGNAEKAQIAVRYENGAPVPLTTKHDDSKSIRTFFRTDETNPVPALVLHLNLPLEQNRERFTKEAVESRPDVVDSAAALIADFVAEFPDCGTALDFLRWPEGVSEVAGLDGKVPRHLWSKIKDVVRKRTPSGYPEHICFEKLRCKPESHGFEAWEEAKAFMIESAGIEWREHGFLPHKAENWARCQTLLRIDGVRWTSAALKKLPLFPAEGSEALLSPASARIFSRPKFEVEIVPPEIGAHFVTEEFQLSWKHFESESSNKLITDLFGLHRFSFESVCHECVVPALKSKKSSDHQRLINFLHSIFPHDDAKHNKPFDWNNPVQAGLCDHLEVCCDDGQWREARLVYASEPWGASAALTEYSKREVRAVLAEPPAELGIDDLASWKRFYSWIGVSWCPKVLPIIPLSVDDQARSRMGLMMVEPNFGFRELAGISSPEWRKYCRSFVAQTGRPNRLPSLEYTSRMKRNWRLDCDLSAVKVQGLLPLLEENWIYYAQYLKAKGHRSSSKSEDHDKEPWESESYLLWSLRVHGWVHSKNGPEWQSPSSLFVEGSVTKQIPDYIPRPAVEPRNADFSRALAFCRSWEQVDEGLWTQMLDTALDLPAAKVESCRERVIRLYLAYLQQQSPKLTRRWWAIIRQSDGRGDQWITPESDTVLYYMDEPHLDSLSLPNIHLFPVKLERRAVAEAAEDRIGAKPLSQALIGTVLEQQNHQPLEQLIRDRLGERLEVVCYLLASTKSPGEREQVAQELFTAIQQIDIHCLQHLNIQLSLEDQELGTNSQLEYWIDRQGAVILYINGHLLNGGEPILWDILARGLAACPGVCIPPAERSSVEKLLAAPTRVLLEREMRNLALPLDQMSQLLRVAESPTTAANSPFERVGQVDDAARIDAVLEPCLDQPSVNTGIPKESSILDASRVALTGTNSEPRPNRKPQNRSRTSGQQRQDHTTARNAEVWLRERLRHHLTGTPFHVDEGVHRDDENRESDIRIRNEDGTWDFHIEVKHLAGHLIYWSEREIRKAKDNSPRYFMALLCGEMEPFQITWLWDPLERLGEFPSQVEWIWPESRESVFHPPDNDWLEVGFPPERPESAPRRSHRIEIPIHILQESEDPFKELDGRLAYLAEIHPHAEGAC
jgi:hypothetical protein